MPSPVPSRRVHLDSAQLRVLAHPLRSRLLSALRAFGPATATELAQRLQTNSGATSYHLRQLADVGLIEEQPEEAGGRRRCWRAAHDVTSYQGSAFEDDADDRAAVDWLMGHHVRLVQRWTEDWLESRREWSTDWHDAADQSDYEFALTPQGLQALNRDLHAVVERHKAEADPAAPGAEKCAIVLQSFPMPTPRL
jgi:DNA-binding transcriptional ArsR family regulator